MSSDRPYYPPPRAPQPSSNQQAQSAGSAVPAQSAPYPQASHPQTSQYRQAVTAKPSAYWPLTIISFLCSFLIGAIAMIFSSQVNAKWKAGDVPGARKASQLALWIGLAGIAIGLFFIVVALGSSGY